MAIRRRLTLIVAIVLVTVGSDQITKHLARTNLQDRGTVFVAGQVVVLRYAENSGGFLSLGAGWSPVTRGLLFGAVAVALVAGAAAYLLLARQITTRQTGALALIVGGGLGNLIDRFLQGGVVTDFLNMGIGGLRTGIFNLADMFLLAGVIVTALAPRRREVPPRDGG